MVVHRDYVGWPSSPSAFVEYQVVSVGSWEYALRHEESQRAVAFVPGNVVHNLTRAVVGSSWDGRTGRERRTAGC